MINDILTALCLVLVLEGILPFLSPDGYKQAMRSMLDLENGQLRTIALSSMIVGVVLLAIVR
ncbi:MAG: DUF2065 domain-containing protein [Granulosicoccus sp.]|nr:DUF2065 domain-containing protein [Granulosicoccus sp.]